MGFLDRAKDAQRQAKEAMAAAGGGGGFAGLAEGMKGMGASGSMMGAPVNVDEQLRYREKAQKLKASGVEAPAVINTITPGETEPLSGSISTLFEVTIKPADGEAYQATIKQSMLAAALDDLSTGDAITVRYDPDDRTSALIYGW